MTKRSYVLTPSHDASFAWRRSTFCGPSDLACVEVAFAPDGVTVRDSKRPGGPVLQFSPREWEIFLLGVRNNEFDTRQP